MVKSREVKLPPGPEAKLSPAARTIWRTTLIRHTPRPDAEIAAISNNKSTRIAMRKGFLGKLRWESRLRRFILFLRMI